MKVNVVKLDADGTVVRESILTSGMLHLEIELDGYTYHVKCGRAQAWPNQDTGLSVTCINGIVVKPLASDMIEVNGG